MMMTPDIPKTSRPAAFLQVALALALAAGPARAARIASESEVEAVPPPTSILTGRILLKDGVTPVRNAGLHLSSALDGEVYVARSGRSGRFRLRVPAGEYQLEITRSKEVFEAPSVYRVSSGGRVGVDFLLLRHFEEAGGPDPMPFTAADHPEAKRDSPVVVGTVVDMLHAPHGGRRTGKWVEVIGFIGTVLAVGLAVD